MWGVAFKAGTDDVRESPAVRIASLLQADGAEVVAYDPEATTDLLTMAPDPIAAVTDADVLLIATEWPEFLTVDMAEVSKVMRGHRVVDARNILDPKKVRAGRSRLLGFRSSQGIAAPGLQGPGSPEHVLRGCPDQIRAPTLAPGPS